MALFRTCLLLLLPCLLLASALPAEEKPGGKKGEGAIVILITAEMKYIKEGDKVQKPITVKVGETVVWKNTDPCEAHTATSKLKKDGKPVFDTGDIAAGKSAKIVFDRKLFESLGGKAGGQVEIDYLCTIHPAKGRAKIILKSAEAKRKE
jgi:plastocyanin